MIDFDIDKNLYWTIDEVISVCKLIESFCPNYGCHVALTGGYLYKEGPRKDLDLLFYRIRQVKEINYSELITMLELYGFEICSKYGWVTKVIYKGKNIDLFFPEMYPQVLNDKSGY